MDFCRCLTSTEVLAGLLALKKVTFFYLKADIGVNFESKKWMFIEVI